MDFCNSSGDGGAPPPGMPIPERREDMSGAEDDEDSSSAPPRGIDCNILRDDDDGLARNVPRLCTVA